MHIAFLHPFLYRYARGIERYTVNLSSALVRQKIEVDILTWRWPRPLVWQELDTDVRVHRLPTSQYYTTQAMVPFYMVQLWQQRYDMIYIHFADYGEAMALNLLWQLGYRQPFSIVLHYPYSQVPHRYHKFSSTKLNQRAASVIAVSQHVASEAETQWARSCTVISHGVDLERFQPNLSQRALTRRELNIPRDAPVLLTVAALEKRKGVEWVLRALPGLRSLYSDLQYVVVGDGPDQVALRQLAADLNVMDMVQWIPATSDVSRFYQSADLFLILSRGEASSIVTLEAMACGIPVIASKHPPFDELIQPEWGIQLDEQDTESLIETISMLLQARSQRSTMGALGRQYVEEHHTWDWIASTYRNLLT